MGGSRQFVRPKSVKKMLTKKQEKWVAHLSNDSKIKIVPFDQSAQEKFEKIKSIIQSKLGKSARIEHHGATGLGISGQDEIDIYVPVPPYLFDSFMSPLTELFNEPRSHYPMERARFTTSIDGKRVDVFLINEAYSGWLESLKFEKYLMEHPRALLNYERLKESCNGMGTQEYYTRKIEFINDVLNKTK